MAQALDAPEIVIGGAAGAFPPIVGWAAVTGSVSMGAVVLFLIIFLWTPPHFWALALYKQSDYGAAGMPMMPNVGARLHQAADPRLFGAAGRLRHGADGPGFFGLVYTIVAVLTGASFCSWPGGCSARGRRRHAQGRATLFTYSLSYLFIVFFALLTDNLLTRFGVSAHERSRRNPRSRDRNARGRRRPRQGAPSPLDRLGHRTGAVRHTFYALTIVKMGPAVFDRAI